MKLAVESPCERDWNQMRGSDCKRFCDHCQQDVYDLSAMTASEAQEVLALPDVCARFSTRADGSVRFKPGRVLRAATVVLSGLVSSPALASGQSGELLEVPGWVRSWLAQESTTSAESSDSLIPEVEAHSSDLHKPLTRIDPLKPPAPPKEPRIMGKISVRTQVREVRNHTSSTLTVQCATGQEIEVAPSALGRLHTRVGTRCTVSRGGELIPLGVGAQTCEESLQGGLICAGDAVAR